VDQGGCNAVAGSGDVRGEMSPDPFDDSTADAFLTGAIAPTDAPLGYQHAADLIRAARSPASTGELAAEDQVVAALLAAARGASPRVAIPRRHTLGKILTLKGAVLASIIFGGGVAVAATGGVPAPVRSAISAGLSAVGLAPSHAADPPGVPGPGSGPSDTTTSEPGNRGASTNAGGKCLPNTVASGANVVAGGVTTTPPGSSTATCIPAEPAGVPAPPEGSSGSNVPAPNGNSNGAVANLPAPTTATSPPKNPSHGPPAGTPNGPPTTAITTTTTTTSTTVPARSGNNGNGNDNGKGNGNGKGNSSGKTTSLRRLAVVTAGTREAS